MGFDLLLAHDALMPVARVAHAIGPIEIVARQGPADGVDALRDVVFHGTAAHDDTLAELELMGRQNHPPTLSLDGGTAGCRASGKVLTVT